MMAEYSISWHNQVGEYLGSLNNFSSLSMAYGEMKVGYLELTMPQEDFVPSDFAMDQIIQVFRDVDGTGNALEGQRSWFVREWAFLQDIDGENIVRLKAYDNNFLLSGRIIAYVAGSSQSSKSGLADNVIKDFVRDNCTSPTDTARIIPNFTVEGNRGKGPQIEKQAAWRNLFETLIDIAGISFSLGTYLTFDVVTNSVLPNGFQFRTWTGQRGVNHGMASDDKRMFGVDYGNLVDVTFMESHGDVKSFIYAMGQGQEDNRQVKTASKNDKISPYARREAGFDARNTKSLTALQNEAQAAIDENKAKKIISGKIQENENTRYGIDFGYGDIVVAEHLDFTVNCRISTVSIQVQDKRETININLRGEW